MLIIRSQYHPSLTLPIKGREAESYCDSKNNGWGGLKANPSH
jgi:hypothetical protein